MGKAAFLMAALLALAGCDRLFPQADNGSADGGDVRNEARSPSGNDQIADAGVTRSRSLAGLTGAGNAEQAGLGGKEPTAIQAGAQSFPPEMLLGAWSDDGNCKQAIEFLADGSFRSYNGEGGSWTLAGDLLTLEGAGGRYQLRIQAIDGGRVVTLNPDGSTGQSTRC